MIVRASVHTTGMMIPGRAVTGTTRRDLSLRYDIHWQVAFFKLCVTVCVSPTGSLRLRQDPSFKRPKPDVMV